MIDQVHVLLRLTEAFTDAEASGTEFTLVHPGGEEVIDFNAASRFGHVRQVSVSAVSSAPGPWTLTVAGVSTGLAGQADRLNPNAIEDLLLILHYRMEE